MNPCAGRIDPASFRVNVQGMPLAGRLWHAPQPRAAVLILHGLGEHGGRYAAFASEVLADGFSVAAVDWPGHGSSPGPRGDASWTVMRDDGIPATLDLLATTVPAVPQHLFGHSMGGAMALDYGLAHPGTVESIVVSSPAVRTTRPPWWKLAAGRMMRRVAPRVGIPHGLPLDALSRDPEVVALYRIDPLTQGAISARLYFDLLDAQQRIADRASALSVPTLMLAGTGDRIVDWTGARDFARAAPQGLARFVGVDEAYHEILNDSGREAAIRTILAWWNHELR